MGKHSLRCGCPSACLWRAPSSRLVLHGWSWVSTSCLYEDGGGDGVRAEGDGNEHCRGDSEEMEESVPRGRMRRRWVKGGGGAGGRSSDHRGGGVLDGGTYGVGEGTRWAEDEDGKFFCVAHALLAAGDAALPAVTSSRSEMVYRYRLRGAGLLCCSGRMSGPVLRGTRRYHIHARLHNGRGSCGRTSVDHDMGCRLMSSWKFISRFDL
ncbi:hypothetical protein K438DRAFT_1773485 [Mycena galopus ATCC 62051]|nr:hypothetical protein K438DRAFT_1773485 [Mycena galopus ATCC 62051]